MKYFTSLSFSLLLSFFAIAQNDGVGIGTVTVEPDAILQIDATAKGILIPRISTEARTEQLSPTSDGLMVYDKDIQAFFYYDTVATQWKRLVQEESFGVVPIGGIIMWSGDAADVPSNFALCDGSQAGVPDLTDRFILGGSVAGEGTQRVALQTDITSNYSVSGAECSEYENLYSLTVHYDGPMEHPDGGLLDLCLSIHENIGAQVLTDIPANSCVQASAQSDFSSCEHYISDCTSSPNPDYYLNNPNCRVAASYYQLAFIMRVE